ncbi:hypothetical protein ACQ33O_10015 [Ferruginibacter sp. SUN002]|uniref:hypothetical protein n=1 Tax=Ferruginibacter sp. SUN002 TaxID=2937789 RepID=UPI003D36269B
MKLTLRNKTICILTQQDWGNMLISKHHYAIALANAGNTVYFIHGPKKIDSLKPGEVKILTTDHPNIFLVENRYAFSDKFFYHSKPIFYLLVKRHISNIVKKIGLPIDITWSFDLSNKLPLRFFPKNSYKIFMPVDEPQHKEAIRSGNGADIILSVTKEILEKYDGYKVQKHFINHGVNEEFIADEINTAIGNPIRVGVSGNLIRPDIDRETFIKIISSNPEIIFECWGAISSLNSNLGTFNEKDLATVSFIDTLRTYKNVKLRGSVKPTVLASEFKRMDAFLICYDIFKDQSKGTNYHKIMEFLATGKVVIANNVTTYRHIPGMIEMSSERDSNNGLPLIFKNVVSNLTKYNSVELQKQRIDFAKQHLYQNQIKKIEALIN